MNERSPLRVFENSTHGGLGAGNIGVVMSRAGVGKTAFLIGVALDGLMRGQKVLHVTHGESVEHVRQFYDEVFRELARSTDLKDADAARLAMERNRMIHSYAAGGFDMEKLRQAVDFLKEHVQFQPEIVILDGFEPAEANEADLTLLKKFAQDEDTELWIPALTHHDGDDADARGVPKTIARFDAWISVMVKLHPSDGAVTVRILKDHGNAAVAELQMKLDPTTLLLLKS